MNLYFGARNLIEENAFCLRMWRPFHKKKSKLVPLRITRFHEVSC